MCLMIKFCGLLNMLDTDMKKCKKMFELVQI